jgi:1,4-dihydroxy-2-naphthoate octaprenyltransferase
MLSRSTLQLLRLPFSFFLLPVFLFACSESNALHLPRTLAVFFILHFLVYPSSNGYNSYMDRDTGPIGGVSNPLQPTKQLFRVTLIMDLGAVLLSLWVSPLFAAGVLIYILVSRAYSYRGVRLKKYPVAGYLTVLIFQGAFTFAITYHGTHAGLTTDIPPVPAMISSLLIGGFYPLTQIYQHEDDRRDGVTTMSYLLGYRGTFIFSGIMYTLAMIMAFLHYRSVDQLARFIVLATCLSPILFVFIRWANAVWHDISEANFNNTMKMTVIASVCTNLAFLTLLIWNIIE